MEKPEGETDSSTKVKKVIDDEPATDAENKLKEETEKAKKELIDQIKNFKTDDDASELLDEQD